MGPIAAADIQNKIIPSNPQAHEVDLLPELLFRCRYSTENGND